MTVYSTFMGGCTFLEHIYDWIWLFREFLMVSVTGCDWVLPEHFYGWECLGVIECDWVWMGV